MDHNLKCIPEFFSVVCSGLKSFEVRYNDREFKVGDTLCLQEFIPCANCNGTGRVWDNGDMTDCYCKPPHGTYTEEEITVEVTYILDGGRFGIDEKYVVMAIKLISYPQGGSMNEEEKFRCTKVHRTFEESIDCPDCLKARQQEKIAEKDREIERLREEGNSKDAQLETMTHEVIRSSAKLRISYDEEKFLNSRIKQLEAELFSLKGHCSIMYQEGLHEHDLMEEWHQRAVKLEGLLKRYREAVERHQIIANKRASVFSYDEELYKVLGMTGSTQKEVRHMPICEICEEEVVEVNEDGECKECAEELDHNDEEEEDED